MPARKSTTSSKRPRATPPIGNVRQIEAQYKGKCLCGATVMAEDRIDYDTTNRKVVKCIACGLKDNRYQGPRKGARQHSSAWMHEVPSTQGQRLRGRANDIAVWMRSVERWTKRSLEAKTPTERAKYEVRLNQAKENLAAEYRDIKNNREAMPSDVDIHTAMKKLMAEEEKRRREEEDE